MFDTQALCTKCRNLVEARYVFSDKTVELRRRCAEDGLTCTVVSRNPDLFASALDQVNRHGPKRRGLIVEMLDGCNMRCPTCIAASSPELSALRRPQVIARQIARLQGRHQPLAILLSGGEPTVHPQFEQFLELVEDADVPRRILITNGVQVAADPGIADRLAAGGPWEVFLQFDSLRPDVLLDMRGDMALTSVRSQALAELTSAGIATTLVCVVKRGKNLDEVQDLVEFAVRQPGVIGLQFQPIRNAGRLENYNHAQHSCDMSDVVEELLKAADSPAVYPHPVSPLSVVVGHYNRSSATWSRTPEATEFFIEPLTGQRDRLRLSILEYADVVNWSSLKSTYAPFNVLRHDGWPLSVDDHFVLSDGSPGRRVVDLHADTQPAQSKTATTSGI